MRSFFCFIPENIPFGTIIHLSFDLKDYESIKERKQDVKHGQLGNKILYLYFLRYLFIKFGVLGADGGRECGDIVLDMSTYGPRFGLTIF